MNPLSSSLCPRPSLAGAIFGYVLTVLLSLLFFTRLKYVSRLFPIERSSQPSVAWRKRNGRAPSRPVTKRGRGRPPTNVEWKGIEVQFLPDEKAELAGPRHAQVLLRLQLSGVRLSRSSGSCRRRGMTSCPSNVLAAPLGSPNLVDLQSPKLSWLHLALAGRRCDPSLAA
jgi:hypothetical protein